jgi:dTDP-4-dehydrorhamnose 3,5-epimerase
MLFRESSIRGVFLIDPEPRADERGFFARTWCQREFDEHGLNVRVAQCGVSFNAQAGTLRGLHYQAAPHEEEKLVRCTQGAIYDVAVDLREGSPTQYAWFAAELTAVNHRMLYIPAGCAHGFLTLVDNSEVYYQISQELCLDSSRGARWDDPAFGIQWPMSVRVISERDRTLPLMGKATAIAFPGGNGSRNLEVTR